MPGDPGGNRLKAENIFYGYTLSPVRRLNCIYVVMKNRAQKRVMVMDRKNMTEMDVEKILRSSRFTNSSHKAALREQLFAGTSAGGKDGVFELSLDELDMAAGGRNSIPELEEEVKKLAEEENGLSKMTKRW